jgi:hypothetical protein
MTMTTKPDLSRRNFLLRTVPAPVPEEPGWEEYFGSYSMACAQVNEARPFLMDDARRLGIATEGKTDLEILKAIFATTGQPHG